MNNWPIYTRKNIIWFISIVCIFVFMFDYERTLTALFAAAVCVTLKQIFCSSFLESTIRILPLELPENMYFPRLPTFGRQLSIFISKSYSIVLSFSI